MAAVGATGAADPAAVTHPTADAVAVSIPSRGTATPAAAGLTGATAIRQAAAVATVAASGASSTTPITTAAATTTAVTPAPLSPIQKIMAIPARIINFLLGVTGIAYTAGTPYGPLTPVPLVDAVFAVFRRIEELVGLTVHPAVPTPIAPTMTYTGPVTTPTPTVQQLLSAAEAEYVVGSTPGGMTPFTVDGKAVSYTNSWTGTSAQVWVTPQNQLIIGYQGTTGISYALLNPLIAVTGLLGDLPAIFGSTKNMPALPDALGFAQRVEAEAAQQGYTPDDIFVTGHSLGGWEAEYVSQNTGLAGIGFESLGLSTTVAGNGANSLFVNTSTYGDPAGYVSTDLPGLQPFTPPYVPGGGLKPHYGPIVMLGDPQDQVALTNAGSNYTTLNPITFLISVADVFLHLGEYHAPSVQAYDLGARPDPSLAPGWGDVTNPVPIDYSDMTIPEFMSAASTAGRLVRP